MNSTSLELKPTYAPQCIPMLDDNTYEKIEVHKINLQLPPLLNLLSSIISLF